MFRDFLTGTVGKLLQIVFFLAGIALLLGGLFGGSGLGIVIGIVFLCMSFGVTYALGNIFRMRR